MGNFILVFQYDENSPKRRNEQKPYRINIDSIVSYENTGESRSIITLANQGIIDAGHHVKDIDELIRRAGGKIATLD
ncbi:hypothetical protein [Rhodovastum atsumiense]|uniref:Uncharacterized protein n=1 Tax=Rhodovastum atsumiense TaxID=504468 RepID=A0A5M6J2F3_9PROT|nr:hypothetical protein [Rhodovastum atsumiense]KAA5613778.1 hypothetical protein F1189_03100 [Rhodovastum atsumiense]